MRVTFDGIIFKLQRSGGIRRVFEELITELAARPDADARVFVPPGSFVETGLPRRVLAPYHRPVRLRPAVIFGNTNARLDRVLMERFWTNAAKGVFVSTYYTTPVGVSVPRIALVHDMIYERYPSLIQTHRQQEHKCEKEIYIRTADLVICPSESTRSDLLRTFPGVGDRVHVLHYGVSQKFITGIPSDKADPNKEVVPDRGRYILHVGGRSGTKNFTALLMAFSRWPRHHEWRIVTVGGGPLTNEENAILISLRLEHQVECIPFLEDAGLVTAYRNASACVVPSLYEGYGFPLLEAMACGIPVASSNASSLPEIGGDVPVYFDPTDNDGIVAALDTLVSTKMRERVEVGVLRARSFTWRTFVDGFVQLARPLAS